MMDSSPVRDGRPFLGFAYKRKPPPQFSEIDVLLPFENQLKVKHPTETCVNPPPDPIDAQGFV